MNTDQHTTTPPHPTLRIISGHPTTEEVAALATVLSARATTTTAVDKPTPPRSEWASHQRRMRPPAHPSPNGWRASAFPR